MKAKICDSWVKICVLNSFFPPTVFCFSDKIDKRKIKLGRWIKRDVCSFLHRSASCFRASLELCFCVFSLFSVEMIRAVLTVEAQQLYCLTCSRILGPNLSQSHICRKQKTSKAALVDIFLSFKLGSFSVSISRLLCSHISCSSSVWRLISLKIRLGVYFWSNILISWLKVKELFLIRPGGVAEDRAC